MYRNINKISLNSEYYNFIILFSYKIINLLFYLSSLLFFKVYKELFIIFNLK